MSTLQALAASLEDREGVVARLARRLCARVQELTLEIRSLEREIEARVEIVAPSLLAICGCAALTAAKIVGETACSERFRSPDAYARHNGMRHCPSRRRSGRVIA